MTLINKKDLQHDYSWNKPGNNPKTQEKESAVFDREEGNDVLQAINHYAEKHNITDKAKGREMESHIHSKMSKDVGTHKEVYEWLKSAFKNDNDNGNDKK